MEVYPLVNIHITIEAMAHRNIVDLPSYKMVIPNSYVKLRAGLRVVPEWSYERQWEAHFSAQAQCFLTLVHLWIRVV